MQCVLFNFIEEVIDIYAMFDALVHYILIDGEDNNGVMYGVMYGVIYGVMYGVMYEMIYGMMYKVAIVIFSA
jgi:hypothetical protein